MSNFTFKPAPWIPYQNKEVLERCRNIKREDMEKHSNPDFKIRIVGDVNSIMVSDMALRIKESDALDKKLVMILPNPCPGAYSPVAEIINRFRINCRNVVCFMMDEWADLEGNVAPLTYRAGFGYSFMKYFYNAIDPELRMPESNIKYFTTKNVNDYSKMIEAEGEADICYSGPGWAGHVAFVDPGTEFATDSVDEFLKMGSRIVTLHMLSVAQNSLHGVFGQSGDLAAVPPCGATIGPRDVANAKNRMEMHAITTGGTVSAWQRMMSRLVLYGEVTPKVPSSILQLMPTTVYVSEGIAQPFGCWETVGY